ncbi:MAG TPA: phage holin family protein [Myxococcota bacterium]|jgi:hypothetical protein|nr:phage holin family protein [Myxococcota bacterium]
MSTRAPAPAERTPSVPLALEHVLDAAQRLVSDEARLLRAESEERAETLLRRALFALASGVLSLVAWVALAAAGIAALASSWGLSRAAAVALFGGVQGAVALVLLLRARRTERRVS